MRLILAAALALLAPAAVAQPQPGIITKADTTAELAAICDPAWSGVPRLEAIAYCQGFLTSAGQYHALLHPAGGPLPRLYCLPTPGPTIAQAGVGFAHWARANPQHNNEHALDGLLRYLQATYPCPPATAERQSRPQRAR
jgi:hypothetical protein